MWYDAYIEKTSGVQGGEPVIAGTRTPVRTIVEMATVAYPGNLDEVARALPHLQRAQIEAALDYYRDHTAEIDAHIARHRTAFEQLQTV
jgi:uncharacterized protein (DUF433 family)